MLASLTALLLGGAPVPRAVAGPAPGHIVVAVGTDVATTDPHKATGGADYTLFANIFEALYGHDLDGRLAPELATDYQVSPDGLAYEFTLRQGVKFHNGDPFTVQDVVFSWQRATSKEIANPRASVLVDNIAGVDVIDPAHIRVRLKKADASFMENLGAFWFIVPQKYIEQVGNQAFGQKPVGTGPYKFVSRQALSNIELEAFKEHWGRVPQVNKVTIRIVPEDNSRIAMLRAGEADIEQGVPPALARALNAMPDLGTTQVPTYQSVYLTINPKSRLADKRIRQAINYAIDKKTMVEKLFFGAATIENAWCIPGVIGCDADLTGYPYDPQKAKQLLTEAGFDFNQPIRLFGQAPGRAPQSKETVETIAAYLSQIGVKSTITLLEYGAWLNLVTAREKDFSGHDLLFWTWSEFNADPVSRLLRVLRTGERSSFYAVPELDKKLDVANDIADPRKRAGHIRDIFAYVSDEALLVPLWNLDMIYGVRKSVEWKPRRYEFFPVLWNLSEKK